MWATLHVSSQLYSEICSLCVSRPFELGHMQLLQLSETTGRPFISQNVPACSWRSCKRIHEACKACNSGDTGDVNGSQKNLWNSFPQVQYRNKASFTGWFRVSTKFSCFASLHRESCLTADWRRRQGWLDSLRWRYLLRTPFLPDLQPLTPSKSAVWQEW